MSLYNGPARGGNRGGKDQFNWESVKSDKDREYYLGHSVKATTGRWQKGKDVFWYTREKQEEQAAKARLELQAIKQREEDLMNEALGIKPKTVKQGAKPKLNSQDMAKLLGRTDSDDQGQPDPNQDPDAVKGLGYAPNLMTGGGSAGREVLGGIGMHGDSAPGAQANRQAEVLPGPPARLAVAQLEQQLQQQEKAAKQARKEAKKAKKAAKKGKKSKGHHKDRQAPKAQQQQITGRHQDSAASDSSASEGSESPPRKRVHNSEERETDAHDHSRPSNRDGGYWQDRRAQQHDRSGRNIHHLNDRGAAERHRSRSPSRGHRHASASPDRSGRQNGHDRHHSRRDYVDRHQDERRRRHTSPSLSPPRHRHRA